MGRIRAIKPGFFTDSELYDAEAESGLPLRVAYAGLWTVADREGRFRWKPREIKTQVLPYDAVDMVNVLDALVKHRFIFKYKCNGEDYGFIPKFHEHQHVNKNEAPSTIPEPPKNSNARAKTVSARASTTPTPDEHPKELVSGVREQEQEGKGREGNKDATPQADVAVVVVQPISLPIGVSQQLWADFLEHRRKLRAPMSRKAQEMALSKLAGMPDAASTIERSIIQGWKGLFEATDNDKRTGKETRLDRLLRGMAGPDAGPETGPHSTSASDREGDENPPRGTVAVLPPAGHERGAGEREIPAFLLRSRAVS